MCCEEKIYGASRCTEMNGVCVMFIMRVAKTTSSTNEENSVKVEDYYEKTRL